MNDSNENESDQRQQRNRNKTKPIDIIDIARYGTASGCGFLEQRSFLHQVVIRGNACSPYGQWKHVQVNLRILPHCGNTQNNGERIHQDALVPTQFAWSELHDFGKKQAAQHRDERYRPR
jgi:hypothetical protein